MMSLEADQEFDSPEEEAAYWKSLAQTLRDNLDDTKEELEEYQISSRELEQELETQLDHAEKRNAQLVSSNAKMQMELDSIREKLEIQMSVQGGELNELQSQLTQVTEYKNELRNYIRDLEQANDDLERAKRNLVESLGDFEGRLNQALERNAFLEDELGEKESLVVTVQRLKDESKELKEELAVKERPARPSSHAHSPLAAAPHAPPGDQPSAAGEGGSRPPSLSAPPTPGSPSAKAFPPFSNGTTTPLTSNARISALNIVGDLLRKVGALESKLASCRNFVRDHPAAAGRNLRTSVSDSPIATSPRSLRSQRPSVQPQGVLKMAV